MMQLFRRESSAKIEHKSVDRSGRFTLPGLEQVLWSSRESSAMIRNGFLNNPIGYRCVSVVSETAAAVALKLQDDRARFESHPFWNLFRQPNGTQSGQELLQGLYAQLLLTGNAYLEAFDWEEECYPKQIFNLRSSRVTVKLDGFGWPSYYEYRVGNKVKRYDCNSIYTPILHVKNFHPTDDHLGFPALHAAGQAVDVHNAASKWSKSLLDNAARPSGAIIMQPDENGMGMDREQFLRLADEIELNHQGAKNAGRPMLLEGGLDWKPMGFSPSDMEFQKTKELAAREIALSFGVPPMILGLPGDNTYANYQEANRAFFRLTILPLVMRVSAAISNWLIEPVDPGLRLDVDLDAVQALAVERKERWAQVSNAGFLTDEEKRKMLGLPAIKDHE